MARLGDLRSPLETGGVLLKGRLLELKNEAAPADQYDSYSIKMPALEAAIGNATIDDVLFWHTHPAGNVGPSKMDLEGRLEGLQYMVVALTKDGAIPVRY